MEANSTAVMSQVRVVDENESQDVLHMPQLPTQGAHTPSHSITKSPENMAFLSDSNAPQTGKSTANQYARNELDSSEDGEIEEQVRPVNTPRRRIHLGNNWWGSMSEGLEREGAKINGVISIPIPFTGRFLRFKIFRWWFSFNGLVMIGILILYTILGLFAWNSTRADHNNIFVLPSTDSIFVISTLSTAGTTLISMLVGSALESVRWRKAVNGVYMATFLGLSGATGTQGKLALLRSPHIVWSTKVWVLIVFAFAAVNYLLSNILTVGLSSATVFQVTHWEFNTMSGIGPWIPHDLTSILYPTSMNMSIRIDHTYDSFTSDSTQVIQLTTNVTRFPGSHIIPTAFRTLCDDGCFAYLLPGTVSQVITPGPQPPIGQTYCSTASPEECVTPPFVVDVGGLPSLLACQPGDMLCIANAILDDRKSPNRSSYATMNTNLTSWPNFAVSDTLRTHGPAAMVYFEPFTFDGPAEASNMTGCQLMTALPYAINICYKHIDQSSFAIGWATCDPVLHNCTFSDTTWRESLTSSTIMSLEQRQVGVVHYLPTGTLNGIEDFEDASLLTINSTQFFNVITSVFDQGTAMSNLIYNAANSPNLAHFGADLRMRDLLTCTYSLGASQIQVDAPLGSNVSWNNAGQAGINIATDRIIMSLTSIIVFATFAGLTLVLCALMFAYSSSLITPNNTDFSELDIASRAAHLRIFDGLSNADNKEVVERIGQERIWLGESKDGRSIEMATERLPPLQLHKVYV
ncbi:hypothetical protein DACRYDRAFT_25118 [Dacryopinax primogenitus]|uniref:Uncharacterized protein n=1 Tax=Dacryopinax primogenitus (strain DJM 731) TaxID=1858805 RepID=M5G0J8_DACPD|nr:uncharacterized protein DACRYDRAFT_25118 [Dacryopinax primogenitus]EJT97327.1 hypothetical protein DACRYDRAFT_25118 [Dacryopinax primogenitus]